MEKEIVICEKENIAGVFEDGKITDFIMNEEGDLLVGDIILGKVQSVVSSIDAAFVSIGKNQNGFIHVSDLITSNEKTGIKSHVREGQNLLVQIARESTGNKGARLTASITIPGRFLVLTPFERKIGISKKIDDPIERDRLIYISKSICQSGYGLIVRTEAIDKTEKELKDDLDNLLNIWRGILKMSERYDAPRSLYRDQDLIYKVLRVSLSNNVKKIMVDSQECKNRTIEMLKSWNNDAFKLVDSHRGPYPLSAKYDLFYELENALQPKVPLPSGGYLIIEQTEALTVIDVNSGKSNSTNNLSDTILQTNKESAVEIARQLKLRDIGGVIVVDFIDMLDPREQQIVWQALETGIRKDLSSPQLGYFSDFSLLEITRQRQRRSLLEMLTVECPTCVGTGRLRNNLYRTDLLGGSMLRRHSSQNKNNQNREAKIQDNQIRKEIDYVQNKEKAIPAEVIKHKKSRQSNKITYPKYDRNNNRYNDNVENHKSSENNDKDRWPKDNRSRSQSEERDNENKSRSNYDNDKPRESRSRSNYDSDKPRENRSRSNYDSDKPRENRSRSNYDNEKPRENRSRSNYDSDKPRESRSRSNYDSDRPRENRSRSNYNDRRNSRSNDRSSKPSQVDIVKNIINEVSQFEVSKEVQERRDFLKKIKYRRIRTFSPKKDRILG